MPEVDGKFAVLPSLLEKTDGKFAAAKTYLHSIMSRYYLSRNGQTTCTGINAQIRALG
jgi:hypothetical protein